MASKPEGPEFTIDREPDASWVLSGEKLENYLK